MLPAGSTCICTRKNDDFPKRIKFRLTHYHITNGLKGGEKTTMIYTEISLSFLSFEYNIIIRLEQLINRARRHAACHAIDCCFALGLVPPSYSFACSLDYN